MINTLAKRFFGSRNERLIKRLMKEVHKISALEPSLQQLSDAELSHKTVEFKARLNQGASLNSVLVEAFAVVREASRRTLGLRHYDVQILGGMILHLGKIAEMHTGEGKTLVATLPLYLNALLGQGAHLVTVNDYLVKRDAEQMGKIFEFLGLSVGTITSGMEPSARKVSYDADITYGTNNEFGFDYLRDNMAFSIEGRVQRGLQFAVVDEVDSILIDEARTPLVISGPSEDSSELYAQLIALMPQLELGDKDALTGDYSLDEKSKQAFLTEAGHQKLEALLLEAGLLKSNESLYSPQNVTLMHYINAVLRAHSLFHKDVDYMVKDHEIVIVDEHTGRAMPGRRWSDGLHQAIEAKEGLKVQGENQTLASITFQNYFRLYQKLSGMTGTADTEAFEFHRTYGLEVVIIPTHNPMIRRDLPDYVFLTIPEKFDAIIQEIEQVLAGGQPILVGTASIETSEYLSTLLKQKKIRHEVLNAKQHAREALVIAEAGRPGALTIATNMAGRGTDIILGGNFQVEATALVHPTPEQLEQLKQDWQRRHDQVVQAGGLYIMGSERHESRRIDNQLRGRSGRQGDPGVSRFFLSLEDNLIRIFISPGMASMMKRMGMGHGEPLESRMITRQIAKAQKKVESHHYDIRKQLLEYDDVANAQRQVIYDQRRYLLENSPTDFDSLWEEIRRDVITQLVQTHIPEGSVEEMWDLPGLAARLNTDFGFIHAQQTQAQLQTWVDTSDVDQLPEKILAELQALYLEKQKLAGVEGLQVFGKNILLQSLDRHWREHLSALDHLRQSIGLRGYAQKDPKQEYKREAYFLFKSMLDSFHYDVVSVLAKVQVTPPAPQAIAPLVSSSTPKIGRNEPCPCGSGKRFKECHGVLK